LVQVKEITGRLSELMTKAFHFVAAAPPGVDPHSSLRRRHERRARRASK
jgi:hypothetical protein